MFPMLYNVFRLAFEFDVSDFQRRTKYSNLFVQGCFPVQPK